MNLADLIARHQRGEPLDYLFFWGHRPSPDGRVSKSCLSQWWPAPFTVDGATYATAEHWMMAKKAELFDPALVPQILAAPTPKAAKALGRKVKNFDANRWEATRLALVTEGNRHKFAQHPDLATWLKSTHHQILVEASPEDAIWGIGLAATHPNAPHPDRWPGLNLLGFALMAVRQDLPEGRG
jgi:hypothetical protein